MSARAAGSGPAKKAMAKKPPAVKAAQQSVGSTEIRELTDAVTIRAIAHPVRMALLEALTREGPLTATQAAEIVDESPANCSFHFRTLQKYGFVEEVPGSTGRSRPWRRKTLGQSVRQLGDNNEASVAAQSLAEMAQARAFEKLRVWISTASTFSTKWRRSAYSMDWLVYLTPEELSGLNEDIRALFMKYRDRAVDPSLRPEGAQAVQLVAYGFPLPPTASGN
jgi:hypothetical protein